MDFAGKVIIAATAVTSAIIGYLVSPTLPKKEEYPEFYRYDNGEILDYYVSVKLNGVLELDEYVKNSLRDKLLYRDIRRLIIRPVCHSDVCKNSSIIIQQDEKKDELVFIIKATHTGGIMTTLMNLVEDSIRDIRYHTVNNINVKYKSKFINREISVERKIPV